MVTLQLFITYVLIPPAGLLLLLLIIPTPECLQTALVRLVQGVLDAHIPGSPNAKFI